MYLKLNFTSHLKLQRFQQASVFSKIAKARTKFYLALNILTALQLILITSFANATDRQLPLLPDIPGHIAVLEDASAALTLSDVLTPTQQMRFRPAKGTDVNFGYTRSAFWLRLSLPSIANVEGILSITPNFLDVVDIYTAAPGKGAAADDYIVQQVGDHRPPLHTEVSAFADALRLHFEAGKTTTVYIRIFNTHSPTQAKFNLGSVDQFGLALAKVALGYGVWFGGMGILLVAQLIFFLFDRKPQYLLLAVSTLFLTLIYVVNLGLSHVLLFPGNGWANDALHGVSGWGALSAFALTHARLLDLHRRSVWLQALYWLIAVVGLIGVGFALLGQNIVFGPIGSLFSITVVPLNVYFALRYAREDGMASLLRALAFLIIGVGSTIAILQRLAVISMPNWIFDVYGMSGLTHILLLTGVLAIRLRDAEKRERLMQAHTLEAAQSAERLAAAMVKERTRELVEARKVAESALEAEKQSQVRQVRFLEVLSHQYRTPLSAIRTSIDSIAFSLPKEDSANRSRIERIRRSVAWLVQILEVNLERSLMQGASFQPEPTPVTAGSILTSTLQRAQDLLNSPDIVLEMDENAAQAVVLADAAMMELAILNLLENAVKYTASTANAPVRLSLSKTPTGIAITVQDRGIGIPAKDLSRIFENGVRGANAGSAEGSGVGLSLVARIIAAHAGTIRLESNEGQGTTVQIILPPSP